MTEGTPARIPRTDAEILAAASLQLCAAGRLQAAHDSAELAVAKAPADASCHATFAAVLDAEGRTADADRHWEQAAAAAPDSNWHRFNRALSRLRRGDHGAGWEDYEARLDPPSWVLAQPASLAACADRRLQPGEPVAGRHILVVGEQGYGDHVMFARFLPRLADAGATVTVAVHREAAPLFRRIGGVDEVLCAPETAPLALLNLSAYRFDRFDFLGSLPRHLGLTRPEDLRAAPYLPTDAAAVAGWRDWLAARGRPGRRKVGLVFQAEAAHRAGGARSIPAGLLGRLQTAGVDWVNLQHGRPGRLMPQHLPGVIDATVEPMPMDRYADLVAALDLVVSVDTLAAHIAGAAGTPLRVVLPWSADWRWMAGERSVWYDDTLLLRQPSPGDWAGALDRLVASLGDGG